MKKYLFFLVCIPLVSYALDTDASFESVPFVDEELLGLREIEIAEALPVEKTPVAQTSRPTKRRAHELRRHSGRPTVTQRDTKVEAEASDAIAEEDSSWAERISRNMKWGSNKVVKKGTPPNKMPRFQSKSNKKEASVAPKEEVAPPVEEVLADAQLMRKSVRKKLMLQGKMPNEAVAPEAEVADHADQELIEPKQPVKKNQPNQRQSVSSQKDKVAPKKESAAADKVPVIEKADPKKPSMAEYPKTGRQRARMHRRPVERQASVSPSN